MGTRIHLVLEDEIAEAYNRATDAFFKAQEDYNETHDQKWGGGQIVIGFEREGDMEVWNGIAKVINTIIEVNGPLDIPESEVTSDYLVKL
jgi:hypothetical protein